MLKKFSVCNFKNFKNKIVLDLGKTCNYEFNENLIKNGCVSKGIIVGINGSGKSNLALALFDIIIHLTDKEKMLRNYSNYLNLNSVKAMAEFKYEFVFEGISVVYKYTKNGPTSLVSETLLIDEEEVVHYDFINNIGFTTLKGAETLKLVSSENSVSRVKYLIGTAILDEEDSKNKIFRAFADYVNNMLMFYSLDERGYQGFILGSDSFTKGIIRANKVKEFEEFLRSQGIDYELVVREVNGEKELFCKFAKAEVVFGAVASTGTRSLALFYYWYIVMSQASFVFIDEFDAFYHFELSKAVIELLKKLPNTQVFVSTHNTDLLSNDLLRPDCYFEIKDNKIRSFNEMTDKDIRKAHNIQKMYKAGAFNGE